MAAWESNRFTEAKIMQLQMTTTTKASTCTRFDNHNFTMAAIRFNRIGFAIAIPIGQSHYIQNTMALQLGSKMFLIEG